MNIRHFLVIIALASAVGSPAHAQDSLQHSAISLSIGVNRISDKDEFQSPYTYRGSDILINCIYASVRAKGQRIIDFTYSEGKIKSIVSPQADNKLLFFNYDYLFNLKPKTTNERFVPSLGMALHTLLSSTNYLPKIESPVSYLSAAAYLTVSGRFLYHFNKKSNVRMLLGLPVFGLVYRPDFEINGKTFTKITQIGKGNLFSAKLQYDCQLTSKFTFLATYHYSYFSFHEPRPVFILQNGLSLGVRRTF